MGQILHGSARTTAAVRRAIQHSEASLRTLASRYGINQKTVAKWRRRTETSDQRPGPKDARSTVLSIEEEAIIVAFRNHTLLALDDCLYALQATIPHLCQRRLKFPQKCRSKIPQLDWSGGTGDVLGIFRWPSAAARRWGKVWGRDGGFGAEVFWDQLGVLAQAVA